MSEKNRDGPSWKFWEKSWFNKDLVWWVVLALLIVGGLYWWIYIYDVHATSDDSQMKKTEGSYSELYYGIQDNKVLSVVKDGVTLTYKISGGKEAKSIVFSEPTEALRAKLYSQKLPDKMIPSWNEMPPPSPPGFVDRMIDNPMWIFIAVVIIISYFQYKKMGGGAGLFGKSKVAIVEEENIKTRLSDVAGCENAKESLLEMVQSLITPELYGPGVKVPHGILLVGPPGTGKTHLARAIAGEVNDLLKQTGKHITFFSIVGSTFVEMYVGVGASRVRDLFEQARKKAPCIIFIDELDAFTKSRGGAGGNNHDEQEQTLTQFLTEMDGFEGATGVIVIAATNRPDVLDPAVVRSGRFDEKVTLENPDLLVRRDVLKIHTKGLPLDPNVDLMNIARGTSGLSCADLANICNRAALKMSRAKKKTIDMMLFEKAKDDVVMGLENKGMVMSDEDKKLCAYHESGHAIVGRCSPLQDPVYKVTIIPRGGAGGVTVFLPEAGANKFESKQKLESFIQTGFGGRIAEEILNGPDGITTGAGQDIEQVTNIATAMAIQLGMSEKLGRRSYVGHGNGPIHLGGGGTFRQQTSEEKSRMIDAEIDRILDERYTEAEKILKDHLSELHVMAEALLRWETIGVAQIDSIMSGETDLDKIPEPVGFERRGVLRVEAETEVVSPQ